MEQIKLEEMIDYHGGLLNADFTKAIVSLYDHVRKSDGAANSFLSGIREITSCVFLSRLFQKAMIELCRIVSIMLNPQMT